MNDELKTRLTKYLDSLEAAGKKGADFVAEQAPETVRQFIAWSLAEHIVYCVSSMLFVCILLYFARWAYVKVRDYEPDFSGDDPIHWQMLCAASSLGAVAVFLCGVVGNLLDIIKIWVAPNVFLIEWAAKLVKGSH